MSICDTVRTALDLPCKLIWGTDPKIELTGTAIEVGIDSILVALPREDPRLCPHVGRRVRVEVVWPSSSQRGPGRATSKMLTCRGSVADLRESQDGTLQLACSIHKGRFSDAPPRPKVSKLRNHWTM